jgi:hypothetical protein
MLNGLEILLKALGNNDMKKKKLFCLTIAQKFKLLTKLDSGVRVKHLTKECGIGMSTIYDQRNRRI